MNNNVHTHCETAADSVALILSSRRRCFIKNDKMGRCKVSFPATDFNNFVRDFVLLCVYIPVVSMSG